MQRRCKDLGIKAVGTNDELQARLLAAGGAEVEMIPPRLLRRLRRALYLENISFRRPWSFYSAASSFRVTRDFPFQWSALVVVVAAIYFNSAFRAISY